MNPEERMTDLRQLAKAATPGPWEQGAGGNASPYGVWAVDGWTRPQLIAQTDTGTPSIPDAAFIAACSPDVILALLDEHERLIALAEQYGDAMGRNLRPPDLRHGLLTERIRAALTQGLNHAMIYVRAQDPWRNALTDLAALEADHKRLLAAVTDPGDPRNAVRVIEGLAKVWADDETRCHELLTRLGAPLTDEDGQLSIVERLDALVPPGPPSAPTTGVVWRTKQRLAALEADLAEARKERDEARGREARSELLYEGAGWWREQAEARVSVLTAALERIAFGEPPVEFATWRMYARAALGQDGDKTLTKKGRQ